MSHPLPSRRGSELGAGPSLPSSLRELKLLGFIPLLGNGGAPNAAGAAPPAPLSLSFPVEKELGWGPGLALGGGEQKEAGTVPPLICSYSWNLIAGYI